MINKRLQQFINPFAGSVIFWSFCIVFVPHQSYTFGYSIKRYNQNQSFSLSCPLVETIFEIRMVFIGHLMLN